MDKRQKTLTELYNLKTNIDNDLAFAYDVVKRKALREALGNVNKKISCWATSDNNCSNDLKYTRLREDPAYYCGKCGTTFKKHSIQKEMIGKKGRKEPKTVEECPYCFSDFDPDECTEVKLGEVKNRPELLVEAYDPEYSKDVGKWNREHWWHTTREEERQLEVPEEWYRRDLLYAIEELDTNSGYRSGSDGYKGIFAAYENWGLKQHSKKTDQN